MARVVLLLFLLAAASVGVGCNTQADSTPNPELGPPPTIPPGRGDKSQTPLVDPKAVKKK